MKALLAPNYCPNLATIAGLLSNACCHHGDVVVIPYHNSPLLGDKLLLSAVFQWIRRVQPGVSIWAIDDLRCSFPMEQFVEPPDRILTGYRSAADEPSIQLTLSLVDHNSMNVAQSPKCPHIVANIWNVLGELASSGIYPKVTSDRSRSRRPAVCGSSSEYFVVHVRSLSREPFKNPDIASLTDLAQIVAEELRMSCLLLGRGDNRDKVTGVRIIDLLYEKPLSWESTIELVRSARFFIGTDSGPRHLAAASGTRLISLDDDRSRFGPFCPGEQISRFRTVRSGMSDQFIMQVVDVARRLTNPDYVAQPCLDESVMPSRSVEPLGVEA